MVFPNTLSNMIIKCSLMGYVTSWSIPGDQHKQLHSKRQNPPTYSWEQSWKTENNNQVTTVTTSTSGIIPPGTGFDPGAARTWCYRYSYTSDFSDTGHFVSSYNDYTPASTTPLSDPSGVIPSNRTPDTSSNPKAANAPKNLSVNYSSPKPAEAVQPKISYTPVHVQEHQNGQPGYNSNNSKPGYNTTKSGYTKTSSTSPKLGYAQNNPSYNSTSIGSTQASTKSLSDTSGLSSASKHVNSNQIKAWLDLHNNYRSQYGVGSVSWNEELVPTAKRQVDKCIWKHTKGNQYGENIAAGQNSASDVVVAWVEGPNEREIWNPLSATPTHFTQVVWKDTTQIGCASRTCETIEGSNLPQSPVTLWACEYNPKGNVQGEYVRNVLAAAGGKPLASASTSASISVDPDNPNAAKARSGSTTGFL